MAPLARLTLRPSALCRHEPADLSAQLIVKPLGQVVDRCAHRNGVHACAHRAASQDDLSLGARRTLDARVLLLGQHDAFPAQGVVLDLQLEGPGRCANLDSLVISIRQAQTGHFRFGPRVPGAGPRRAGKRLRRWCRGAYRLSVVAFEEFEPSSTTIASGRFTVH